MTASFDEKIRKTVADEHLQNAIYAATGRLSDKRRETVALLPEYQELVRNPKWLCRICGRAAADAKNLCDPIPL